ncbi:ribokinase-like protein [Leptotrombidium deliense]|uniref:Ribokinase n=1 Tax=Leptotrombidium deliense TaxID=299467 RepID=A0A443SR79_9ACAR|nr:ribokinase-like protein [Leptotrombidium deliense]
MASKRESQRCDCAEAAFMGAPIMDLMAYAARFPKPGETISGKQFKKSNGGKSANGCVMAAKLGLSVKMVAKIGNDSFGSDLMGSLKTFGVNTENVFITSEAPTATALICVTDDGQNSIVYTPGASNLLSPKDIESRKANIFNNLKLFVSTYECKPQTLEMALKLAKQANAITFVNGAPPFPEKYDKSAIIGRSDIFCVNESEAADLTGKPVNSVEDAKRVVVDILKLGCSTAMITVGKHGTVYVGKDENRVYHVPAKKVEKVVDTTGAGDAFVGALAYFLLREPKITFEEKVRRSCFIASVSTEREGTQSGYPTKDQLPKELFSN